MLHQHMYVSCMCMTLHLSPYISTSFLILSPTFSSFLQEHELTISMIWWVMQTGMIRREMWETFKWWWKFGEKVWGKLKVEKVEASLVKMSKTPNQTARNTIILSLYVNIKILGKAASNEDKLLPLPITFTIFCIARLHKYPKLIVDVFGEKGKCKVP